ncbi:protein C1orf43 isoform X2 [Gasterosteus aculeatus]|uniref:Chromosome 1 open reading frame 43 n=1 Tax=Gasterosteus aculeatus aculeatus TaxID=481459 RepID=A0AAQ4Q2R3_GASAC|nr:protein C1orf43-like isoform X1 [Gasterosteus aculeatus aculeatus]
MAESPPLSGVNVVLVMAYGSLVFVLLFIFVKRQIMRFAMRSRRGPHAPIGHNAPKGLREEIDSMLSKVHEIRFEPRLLSEEDDRLRPESQISQSPHSAHQLPPELCCYNYLYRMKALDAIRDSGIPLQEISRSPSAFTGRSFRNWLMELRNSHSLIKSSRSPLIDRLLEGYDSARHGTGVFGEVEFLEYQRALDELADVVKAYSSTTSLDQHHQSAAKDLTGSPVRSSPSTIQVTYLPSTGQRSKRPKHFLELKSFKDKYNTLESTL